MRSGFTRRSDTVNANTSVISTGDNFLNGIMLDAHLARLRSAFAIILVVCAFAAPVRAQDSDDGSTLIDLLFGDGPQKLRDNDGDCGRNAPPIPSAGPDLSGTVGQKVYLNGSFSRDFDGRVVSAWWNFGDGNWTGWQRELTVPHIYAAPGTYVARVWVKDNCGAQSISDAAVITVQPYSDPCINNQRPVAHAGADVTIDAGEVVQFSAAGSRDPDGQIVGFAWVFEDGTPAHESEVSRVYPAAGTYVVSLRVVDNCQAYSAPDEIVVNVRQTEACANNTPPTAEAGADRSVLADTDVAFDGSASQDSDGEIRSYVWSFGDGSGATGKNVTHRFGHQGTYQVELVVHDDCGARSAPDLVAVTVAEGDPCLNNQAPTAAAGADLFIGVGQTAQFNGGGSTDADGTIRVYEWDFGDSGRSYGTAPTHVYAAAGSFTVTLKVMDDCARWDDDTLVVTVSDNPCANNQPPAANAGPDRTVATGQPLLLDASGSTDPNGNDTIAKFWWNFGDGQASGWITTPTVTHTYSNAGTLTAKLWVKDACGAQSGADHATIVVGGGGCTNNQPPTASAGADQTVDPGVTVNFDGGASSDADGSIVAYEWYFGDDTMGEGRTPTHVYAEPGLYTVALRVRDNCEAWSSYDLLAIVVSDPCLGNQAPTANAGADQSAIVGQSVAFDGRASSDPDGTIQVYEWTFGDGGTGGGATASHTFIATGTYQVKLRVKDSCGMWSSFDTCVVTVSSGDPCEGNHAPTASAGPDQSAETGDVLTFDASASTDSDGTIQTYSWNFGGGVTKTGKIVTHSWATAGTYTVTLTVTDNCSATATDACVATITPTDPCQGNHAPVANAGADKSVDRGVAVTFDASLSTDPDGNSTIQQYYWDFGDGQNSGWLSWANKLTTHTYAADGSYTAKLKVKDACVESAFDSAAVTVNHCIGNVPPVANAGTDKSGDTGQTLTFDGGASTDSDGTIQTYSWNFGGGVTKTGKVVTHSWSADGTYNVTLTVTDECGGSGNDTVVVNVNHCLNNTAPVANAGADQSGDTGQTLTFDGGASTDSDGTIQTYSWNFGGGVTKTGKVVTHSWSADGTYNVTLTVTDECGGSSSPDTVVATINHCAGNVAPVANAGADQSGETGQTLTFDASGSTDSDGTIQTYSWDFGGGVTKTGKVVTNSWSSSGSKSATLTVTDECGGSDTDTVVAIINAPPVANAGADQSGGIGQVLTFDASGSSDPDGTIQDYTWVFTGSTQSGSTQVGKIVTQSWSAAGSFTATLTVTDDRGSSRTDVAVVTITSDPCSTNHPPVAEAGPDKSGTPGVAVNFDGSGSTDPDGNSTISKYWWNYGDGQSSGWLTTPTASHAYASPGTYTLKLWVKDTCNAQSAADTATVTIGDPCASNQPPTANAGADQSGVPNQTLTFDGGGSSDPDGTIQSYSWDFGGGNTKTGKTVTNSWSSAGTYNVTLTVTDACGATHADAMVATIQASNLKADFKVYERTSVNPDVWAEVGLTANNPVEFGVEVKFDASLSQGAAFYEWELAQGVSRWGQPVFYRYTSDGQFAVKLTVYDAGGVNSATVTKTVHVKRFMTFLNSLPFANLAASDLAIEGNIAWVSHLTDNLSAIDISNVTNPALLSQSNVPAAWAIASANGNLLLASADGLRIYRAQAPNPPLLSVFDTASSDGQVVFDVDTTGRTAFVAAGPAGLKVLSIVNPAAPQVVGTLAVSAGNAARMIKYANGRVYLVEYPSNCIRIVDVSGYDLWTPTWRSLSAAGSIDVGTDIQQFAISPANIVAVDAAASCNLYDASNALNIVLESSFDLAALFGGWNSSGMTFASDSRLYVASGPIWGGPPRIARFDVLDPTNPSLVEWVQSDTMSGINLAPVIRAGTLIIGNTNHRIATIDLLD
ncbi:MAG: hypothetical protein CHACPFDD_02635 [Phycisphaerae bacterium]|nr:hypothetical protein [Phycisphaerae bacterium]